MIHINLEKKIKGTKIVGEKELILGFLETFQEDASEERFATAAYWDVIKFFIEYCYERGYFISKLSQVVRRAEQKMLPDMEARCKRFYYPGWREKIKKES